VVEKVAADLRSKIIHARTLIGDRALMGSGAPRGPLCKAARFSVSLTTKDSAEADRIFNELGQSGNVTMPI
jgi:uncharacterized glyoxalase superfamily protein PhnB